MHRSPTNHTDLGRPDVLRSGGLDVRPSGVAIAEAAAVERDLTTYELRVKPVMDRVGGALILFLALPVLLLTALAVRLKLGKGVFYTQERIGWKGQAFTVYKFRTMHPDRRGTRLPFAGRDRRKRHKTPDDPRHTAFGRFLRNASLDELPQLWNVVRGELSLVGPRPELVGVVEQYEEWQHRRHAVKPGLTGLWQVTERDERGEMHLHVETDLRYVRSLSFVNDLKILAVTPLAILGFAVESSFGLRDLGKEPPVTTAPTMAERQSA